MDSNRIKRTQLLQRLEMLNRVIKGVEQIASQTGVPVLLEQIAEVYKKRAEAKAELAALPPASEDAPPPTLDGYSLEELIALIDSSLKAEDFDEAVRVADELIRRDQSEESRSKSANVYYRRGKYFYGFYNYELALKDFDAALSLKPDYSAVFVAKGECFNFQGDYEQALSKWNKALEVAHEDEQLPPLVCRSRLYYQLGSHKYKVEKKLAKADPTIYDAFAGQNFSWQELYQLALNDLDVVLLAQPKPQLYYLRAEIYLYLQDYEKALKDCNEAIRIEGISPDYILRSRVYRAMGNTEAAVADAQKSEELRRQQSVMSTVATGYMRVAEETAD